MNVNTHVCISKNSHWDYMVRIETVGDQEEHTISMIWNSDSFSMLDL